MVSELWGCCRDQNAFGYFGVPLPKIGVYLQDSWCLLSETHLFYNLAPTKNVGYCSLILWKKKQPELTGNHHVNFINVQIILQWFHVLLYQFHPISRSSPLPPLRQERFWIRGRRGGNDWILSSLQWIIWRHLREPWAGALLLTDSSFQWTTTNSEMAYIYIYLFILFSLLGSTYMCGVTMERSLSGFDWTLFRTQFCILHVNMLPFCWYMGSIFSPHPPSPSTYTLLHTRTWGHLIKPPCLFPNAFYLCFSKSNHTWEFKIKQRLSWSHHWFCRIRAAVSADCTVSKVASRRKAQDTHTRTHCGKWLGAE